MVKKSKQIYPSIKYFFLILVRNSALDMKV